MKKNGVSYAALKEDFYDVMCKLLCSSPFSELSRDHPSVLEIQSILDTFHCIL